MDLAIRTLPLAPSQSHHHILHVQRISTAGSLGFSSSQHCLLACKKLPHLQRVHTRLRIPHCNADGAGSEAAGEADRAPGIEEKPGASPQPQETPPEEPLSTLPQVSPSTKASDPYAGWDSADDYVKDSKSGNSSWMKIGTITILSIGLALGAGFLYTRKEASREFSAPPPVKEQVVPSVASSDSLQASENLDESSGIPKLQQNDQKEFVKQDRDVSFEPESKTAAAWLKPLGRVVVPASVDHMQEQVLAALQALKVIETGVQAGDICTRREYARWLISTSGILSRSPAHKVFPAMYIEDGTKLAYDDVLPEDPDFPFIQGLAEAGLISSRLLANDGQSKETLIQESQSCKFYPDSPLTRQDLVSWKVAFEREHHLPPGVTPPVEKEVLQKVSGFVDIDMVDRDAWPALLADLSSGEKSIISLAFGYTRRFQPEKPVTKAQAAVALATGEAWELVSEELARLEAESIAEAAVAAELALESRAQQEVVAAFNELLKLEQEKQEAATSLVEKTRAELEKVKADWEEEKVMLLKERAALDSEKEFFSKLRHEVEEHALTLSNTKFEVALEKEQAERLRAAAEEERESIRKVRSELEIEKNALSLARIWAEEEARKAHAHAKLLEQARKRWENEGVQVHVDKELDESNIPGPTWRYSKDVRVQKSYIEMLKEKGQNIGKVIMDTWIWVLHFVHLVFCAIRQKASELLGKLDENYHVSRDRCSNLASKAVETFQQTVPTALGGVASGVREGTSKVVSEMREGAERLAQKLKIA